MHVTVVPASPKTGQAAIRALLADPRAPTVRGYYRDATKVPAEFRSNPRFEAVKGDVEDAASLDFAGSDAVLNITPPLFDERDVVEHARHVSENVKAAVKKAASVKRLVYLSSVGAQYDHGTGEILSNHAAEAVLKDAAPEVVFVRCTYFMENWAMGLETLAQGFFFTTLTPPDRPLSMVAVQDIAAELASALLSAGAALPARPYAYELHGPRDYTSNDVRTALEEAAGRTLDMKAVPREGLYDFYAAVFPPKVAQLYAEMNASYLEGGILDENPRPTGEVRRGATELGDVFRGLVQG
ncbi:hypothetical protein VTJ83DRAFT_5148 [Remersonia thermophila]|uniref:NAD(P)-binding domain-containing protein n=1 Tax=Remersonia thermophila TaxID=72144 RepID=A0ABR4DC18_9PEZI